MRSRQVEKAFKFPKVKSDCVRLHLNENAQILPNSFIRNLRNKVEKTLLGTYPSVEELQVQITTYVGVEKENILITPGSDQAIELIFENYFENKKLALQIPSFLAYEHLGKIYGTEVNGIPYQEFAFNKEIAIQALENSHGIALSNPGNPLGASIPQEDLEEIASIARKENKICVFDEAYYEFGKETFVSKLHEYSNVIILRTFSKAFGLAGLRIGYVVADKEIVEELKKLQLPSPISSFAILAASLALREKDFSKKREEILKKKEKFEKELEKCDFSILETKTNFSNIFVDDPKFFAKALLEEGVAIMPLPDFSLVRVAVPEKPEKMAKLFKKVRDLQK